MLNRMLGIPESAAEPGPYELLGLDPGESDRAAITEALQNRKRQLRQNIPNPRFIPLLALFEKDLDAAAAVLLDPARRAAYLDHRQRLGKQGKLQRLEDARNRFSIHVQQIVRSSLNPDGSLNDEQRALLAQRLQQLRFVEHKVRLKLRQDDIDGILARIPRSAPEPGQAAPNVARYFQEAIGAALADDFLSPNDQQRLAELAVRLGLDASAAREMVNAAVREQGAWRPLHPGGSRKAELPNASAGSPDSSAGSPVSSAGSPVAPTGSPSIAGEQPINVARVPFPRPAPRRLSLARIVVPAVAIAAFAAFAVVAVKRHARETAPAPPAKPPARQQAPPVQPPRQSASLPDPALPPEPPPILPQPPDAKQSSAVPALLEWKTLSLKELRECYTKTKRSDELLADLAITMFVCCVRMDALLTHERIIGGALADYRANISGCAGKLDDEDPDDPLPVPYRRHLKLVASTVRHSGFLNTMLQAWSNGEHRPSLRELEEIEDPPATPAILAELAAATGETTAVLSGIVRRHPSGGPAHLARADFIENEREVRWAASANPLQQTAAGLDAVGDLLEVLVDESAPRGTADELLRRAHAGFNEDDAQRNVLFELRENAWRIVALLDVLLSLQ